MSNTRSPSILALVLFFFVVGCTVEEPSEPPLDTTATSNSDVASASDVDLVDPSDTAEPPDGSVGADMAGDDIEASDTNRVDATVPPGILIPDPDPEDIGPGGFVFYMGQRHRPITGTCPLDPRTDDVRTDSDAGVCTTDLDCTDAPNGYCDVQLYFNGPEIRCDYGCASDAECGDGEICLCGSRYGECVPASCVTDDECAGDLKCLAWHSWSSGCAGRGKNTGFRCQSPLDTCVADSECTEPTYGLCQPSGPDEERVCVPVPCAD